MCKITNGLSLLHFHKIYLHLDFSNGLIFFKFKLLVLYYCVCGIHNEIVVLSSNLLVLVSLIRIILKHLVVLILCVCVCVCVLLPYYISSRPSVVVVKL